MLASRSQTGLLYFFLGVVGGVLRGLRGEVGVGVYVESVSDSGVACGMIESTKLKFRGNAEKK